MKDLRKRAVMLHEGSGYNTPPYKPYVDSSTARQRVKRTTPRPYCVKHKDGTLEVIVDPADADIK